MLPTFKGKKYSFFAFSCKLTVKIKFDLFFVTSEVVADETKSVDAVLKADTKRLELLAEEERLTKLVATGDKGISEKLKEVECNIYMWSKCKFVMLLFILNFSFNCVTSLIPLPPVLKIFSVYK